VKKSYLGSNFLRLSSAITGRSGEVLTDL